MSPALWFPFCSYALNYSIRVGIESQDREVGEGRRKTVPRNPNEANRGIEAKFPVDLNECGATGSYLTEPAKSWSIVASVSNYRVR